MNIVIKIKNRTCRTSIALFQSAGASCQDRSDPRGCDACGEDQGRSRPTTAGFVWFLTFLQSCAYHLSTLFTLRCYPDDSQPNVVGFHTDLKVTRPSVHDVRRCSAGGPSVQVTTYVIGPLTANRSTRCWGYVVNKVSSFSPLRGQVYRQVTLKWYGIKRGRGSTEESGGMGP